MGTERMLFDKSDLFTSMQANSHSKGNTKLTCGGTQYVILGQYVEKFKLLPSSHEMFDVIQQTLRQTWL